MSEAREPDERLEEPDSPGTLAAVLPLHPEAAEHAVEQGTHKWSRVRDALGKVTAAAIVLLPPTAGVASGLGLAQVPADINTGVAGVKATARIQQAGYSGITYGPTFGLPKAHATILGVNFGIDIDVKQFDPKGSADREQTIAAIGEDPSATLGPEVKSALIARGLEGLGVGLSVFGLLEVGRRRGRRKIRTHELEDEERLSRAQELENVPEDVKTQLPVAVREGNQVELDTLTTRINNRRKHQLRNRIVAASLSVSSLAVASATVKHEVDSLSPAQGSHTVVIPENPANADDPLVREIAEEKPALRGLFITDAVGSLVKKGSRELLIYGHKTDGYWKDGGDYIADVAVPELRAKGGMAWEENPNIIALGVVADEHGSRPYFKNFLPKTLKALGVDYVLNLGDQKNFSGKSILDNGVTKASATALPKFGRHGKPVLQLKVAGNHDPENSKEEHDLTFKTPDGKTYHPTVALDKTNGYTAIMDGITFIGSPDLNRTTDQTTPSTKPEQVVNDAKQGELLADKACATYDETGVQPILLAHEQEATYEAVARGCVKLALSGHLHQNLPVHAYVNKQDGSITYQQTVGSASGDGANNVAAIYNRPTTVGEIVVWLYDKSTGQLLDYTITVYEHPNGLPTIEDTPLPTEAEAAPATNNDDIHNFLEQHRPAVLSELMTSQDPDKGKIAAEGHPR